LGFRPPRRLTRPPASSNWVDQPYPGTTGGPPPLARPETPWVLWHLVRDLRGRKAKAHVKMSDRFFFFAVKCFEWLNEPRGTNCRDPICRDPERSEKAAFLAYPSPCHRSRMSRKVCGLTHDILAPLTRPPPPTFPPFSLGAAPGGVRPMAGPQNFPIR